MVGVHVIVDFSVAAVINTTDRYRTLIEGACDFFDRLICRVTAVYRCDIPRSAAGYRQQLSIRITVEGDRCAVKCYSTSCHDFVLSFLGPRIRGDEISFLTRRLVSVFERRHISHRYRYADNYAAFDQFVTCFRAVYIQCQTAAGLAAGEAGQEQAPDSLAHSR